MNTDPTSSGRADAGDPRDVSAGDDPGRGGRRSAPGDASGEGAGASSGGEAAGADGPDEPADPLDFDTYQEKALETALFPDIGGERAVYPALGLADEAGEVLGKIKKLYRDRGGEATPAFRRELAKELGDVYWYLAVLADAFDLRSSDVAEGNLRKLADRAERGVIRGEGDER